MSGCTNSKIENNGNLPGTPTQTLHDDHDTEIIAQLQDSKRDIRLIRMIPGDFDDDIHCSLTSYELDNAPSFHAISYTWGEEHPKCEISISGRRFEVRYNRHFALRQARLYSPDSFIWIDSICINQEDEIEKGHQVGIMGDIYARASRVLACIGESDAHFERALEILRVLAKASHSEVLDAHERYGGGDLYLESLGERPYFQRLWILQELKEGYDRTTVLCGTHNVSWSHLLQLNFCGNHGWEPKNRIGRINKRISSTDAQSLGAVLIGLHQFQCQNPRDRVYGTLRFVDWGKHGRTKPEPDYKISCWDLGIQLMSDGHITQHAEIGALVRALGLHAHNIETNCNGPERDRQMVVEVKVRGACLIRSDDAGNLSVNLVAGERDPITYDEAVNISDGIYKGDALVTIFSGSRITALACPDTRVGDIILQADHNEDIEYFASVIRPLEDYTFQVVGKAILLDGFTLPYRRVLDLGLWHFLPGESIWPFGSLTWLTLRASVSDTLASYTLLETSDFDDPSSDAFFKVLKNLFTFDLPKAGTILSGAQPRDHGASHDSPGGARLQGT